VGPPLRRPASDSGKKEPDHYQEAASILAIIAVKRHLQDLTVRHRAQIKN
jgi:hypothetical protein